MQPSRREEALTGLNRTASRQNSSGGSANPTGAIAAGVGSTNVKAAAAAAAGGLQPLQQKLQQHIDREDRRIKELTEAILYEFLPRALRAAAGGDDLARDLTPDKCRAVAGAALAVAALMNAPPGFLEFLLCAPWSSLGQLYPLGGASGAGADSGPAAVPAAFFDWSATAASSMAGTFEGNGSSSGGMYNSDGSGGCPRSHSMDSAPSSGPAVPQLEVSKEERAAIVNLPLLDAALMDCVLDFLLCAEHAESLPPIMRLSPADPLATTLNEPDPQAVTRDTVAALLDGATALHCAAIRGNPAQVDHLLLCGADPLFKNAAGEMPVENVPVCGDRCVAGKLSCRCMAPRDQEAWECRSRLARTLILRRSVVSWGGHGFGAWLRVVVLCLLCLLGLWGHHTSLRRPAVEAQVALRRERRRQAALQRAQATLLKLRTNVASGREILSGAGAGHSPGGWMETGMSEGQGAPLDPGEAKKGVGEESNGGVGHPPQGGYLGVSHAASAAEGAPLPDLATGLLVDRSGPGGVGYSYRLAADEEAHQRSPGAFDRAERAYGCFTAAVDLLQLLDLGGGLMPRAVVDVGGTDSPSFLVSEEEQAGVYAGWAEAALLKFRACGCMGCASLALHTALAAHRQLAGLFAAVERQRRSAGASKPPRGHAQAPAGQQLRQRSGGNASRQNSLPAGQGAAASGVASERAAGAGVGWEATAEAGGSASGLPAPPGSEGDSWQRVGQCLATAVHVTMCVLLGTDVRQSATRAGVWRAQQCLQEWARLRRLGLTEAWGGEECLEADCLEGWCRAAAADLVLAEALRGEPVGPRQPLAEVLPLAVQYDMQTGAPSLNRPVSREVVAQLSEALALARPFASPHVLRTADAVARKMQDEIGAGDRLWELLQPRSGGGPLLEQLSDAIAAAESFPNLQAEVEQARGLRERWIRRSEAQAQLDAVVDDVAAPAPDGLLSRPPGGGPPVVDADAFWRELNGRLSRLEEAAEAARQANIGVSRAKRVLKELAGQGAAVEAAARLDEALAEGRGGSGAIKAALAKAEAALAGASGGAGCACAFQLGAELLTPRIQVARGKLELERAAEGLARTVASCKGVGDLPRLEAAILAARKLGAQSMHPEAYRAASELRGRLEAASRARSNLEGALRGLQKNGRQEDVDAVERAVEDAAATGELLSADCGKAREAVQRWRAAAASEAKLTKALREGAGTQQLSRAIKEAAASGVKVGEARRLLKVMQGLEAAVQAALEGPFQYQALKAKIEGAESGGAPPGLVASARATMHQLLLREVKGELDAVLKAERNKADKSVTQRFSALKAVLDKAEAVLSMDGEPPQHAQHGQSAAGAGTASYPHSRLEVAASSDTPRGARLAHSSSAASQSFSQEVGDAWEEDTAASGAAPGAEPPGAAHALPAAVAGGGKAKTRSIERLADSSSSQPLSPSSSSGARGLSRADTGASAAASEGAWVLSRTGTDASLTASERGAGTETCLSAGASAATSPRKAGGQCATSAAAGTAASAGVASRGAAAASGTDALTADVAGPAGVGPTAAGVAVEDNSSRGFGAPQESRADLSARSLSTAVPSVDGNGASQPAIHASTPGTQSAEALCQPLEPSEAASDVAEEPSEQPGEPPGEGEAALQAGEEPALVSSSDEGEGAEGEDDLAAVLRMVRRAKRQLAREEAEQARIERERAEEAQARREAQAQLKAEREKADRERAEKAKAERAERRAAQEAARAERRERERQARVEREREREGRERAAREHFAALQRQRRAQQQQQAQGHALASPHKVFAGEGASDASLQGSVAGLTSPHGGALAQPQHPPSPLPPRAAAMLDAAQRAQHARADSLEMLSVRTGLLDLLNDHPGEAEPGVGTLGPLGGGLLGNHPPHSSQSSLLSPTSTSTTGEGGWEGGPGAGSTSGTAQQAGEAMSGPLGTSRWQSGEHGVPAGLASSLTGSEQSLGASLLSPDWSPARLGAPNRIRFSDLGGASWLAEGGAGPPTSSGASAISALENAAAALPQCSSGLGLPALAQGGNRGLGAAAGSNLGLGGAGSGSSLWGPSGSEAGTGPGASSSSAMLGPHFAPLGMARDDLALLGLNRADTSSSSIWQSAQSSTGGEGWGAGANTSGRGLSLAGLDIASGSLLASALSPPRAPTGVSVGGAAGMSPQQQQRQQQLLAAIDAAKVQVQQNQLAAVAAAQQAQQQQGRVCKYFLQGFCREGHKCRYLHTTATLGPAQQAQQQLGLGSLSPRILGPPALGPENTAAALSAFQASRLGLQSLLGGPAGINTTSGAAAAPLQLSSGGGLSMPMSGVGPPTESLGVAVSVGAVSSFAFGAPGSLAFNSAPSSRSPTPDVRAMQTSGSLASTLGPLPLPPAAGPQLGRASFPGPGSSLGPLSPPRLTGGAGMGSLYAPSPGRNVAAPVFHPAASAPLSMEPSSGLGRPAPTGATTGGSGSVDYEAAAAALPAVPPGGTTHGQGVSGPMAGPVGEQQEGQLLLPDGAGASTDGGSPNRDRDHYGLPSEASLFSDLLPEAPAGGSL